MLNNKELLIELSSKLDTIIEHLGTIVRNQATSAIDNKAPLTLDVSTMLSLPDHLRKTAFAVTKLGRVTAQAVADVTMRERAVESAYLNSLCIMGYLKKERDGRKVFFWIEYDTVNKGAINLLRVK